MKLLDNMPPEIRSLIYCLITISLAIAIANSDSLVLNQEGLKITRTAINNQQSLEDALEIIQHQQTQLASIKNQALEVKQATNYCGKIADKLEVAESNLSDDLIAPLEAQLATSQDLLN
jgi:aminopeptidase N